MAKKQNIPQIINNYVADVLSGRLPSCNMIKLACQRYLDDWKREDLFFDWQAVERFCVAGLVKEPEIQTEE